MSKPMMAVLVAFPLFLTAAPSLPVNSSDRTPTTPAPSESATADVGPQGLEANVTSTSQIGGTVPFQRVKRVPVPVMCWMSQGPTGAQYAQDWGEGGRFWKANDDGRGYAYVRSVYPDFMQYADKEGHWYASDCRADAPPEVVVQYVRTHPPQFVEPGQPVPAEDPHVDPEVLMHAARDAMILPTGTIRWNPSLDGSGATVVNLPTFVWVENSTTAVQVRAEIDQTDTWAQIDAHLTNLTLTADGAEQDKPCPDNGTPYTPGMTTSTCTITFLHSSAGQQTRNEHGLPTTTLTATANWTATWTSSLDPTPRELDIPPTTTTAQVPVAEIQTIVTR